MICAKWIYVVDFDIITFLAIWRTERNGSSEVVQAIVPFGVSVSEGVDSDSEINGRFCINSGF
jgi:hypothetical protein